MQARCAVSWAQAALAGDSPSGGSQTGHDSRVRTLARRVVSFARHQVGVAYSWGGTSPRDGLRLLGPRLRGVPLDRLEAPALELGPAARRPADSLRAPAAGRPGLHRGRRPCPARGLEASRDLGPRNGRGRPLRAAGAASLGVRRRAARIQVARGIDGDAGWLEDSSGLSELEAALLGGFIGGALGVTGAVVTSYFGPRKLEEWRERRDEERRYGPRKELLRRMLNDPQLPIRSFDLLKHVTGTTDEDCRRLLIEIGARGVVMRGGGEGWALIDRYPLDRDPEVDD
jgi:hypothetical protein